MPKGMFAKAKEAAAPTVAAKGSKTVEMVPLPGLEDYATLDSLIENLTSIRDMIRKQIANECWNEFSLKDHKKRPENYRAFEGMAEASIQLRKRGANSPLNPDEIVAFAAADIPVETVEVEKKVFYINPKYAGDESLIKKIENVKGLPEDFIEFQHGKTKTIVTEESIATVYAKGLMNSFLKLVCVLGITPKLKGADMLKALAVGEKYIKAERAAVPKDLKAKLKASVEQLS